MLRRAVLVLALLLAPPLAHAEDRSAGDRAAEAAIRARLAAWTEAFNRGDAAATCDLFADDLKSDVQGAPAGDKAAVCARLAKALAKSPGKLAYVCQIHEILVSGDLAMVRLTWVLTERPGGNALSRDEGMDILRRDPDGLWRIARFMAFTAEGEDARGAAK
ncbi:nuclear transport factor 2 family protein [Xanthobacter sp. 126]|uniref:YybH family protein n=1 Tax=Xanthobacter sp. 126 TaxID=1131814 RepID=UPI00045EAD44|nr:nuclear transport factor 2 family protein [Xanthobacter sp. 126]